MFALNNTNPKPLDKDPNENHQIASHALVGNALLLLRFLVCDGIHSITHG